MTLEEMKKIVSALKKNHRPISDIEVIIQPGMEEAAFEAGLCPYTILSENYPVMAAQEGDKE